MGGAGASRPPTGSSARSPTGATTRRGRWCASCRSRRRRSTSCTSAWSLRMAELLGVAGADPARARGGLAGLDRATCDAWMPGEPLEPLLEHLADRARPAPAGGGRPGRPRRRGVGRGAPGRAVGRPAGRRHPTFYRATYGPDQPWPASAERLIQVAIEGMHGHLGGPTGGAARWRSTEHDDRVALTFHTCGSGGRILAAEPNGVRRGHARLRVVDARRLPLLRRTAACSSS